MPSTSMFERPFALITPTVTLPSRRPKGLPIAIAQSPTRIASESPHSIVGRARPGLMRSSATSVAVSMPTIGRDSGAEFHLSIRIAALRPML